MSQQIQSTPASPQPADVPADRPPNSPERRNVALHKQDFTWARATARHLRARGIADTDVERILSDRVEVFVRRGRHGREVFGTPRTQAATHLRGTTRHSGRLLRLFVGVPLVLAAVVCAVLAVTSGPLVGGVGAAAALAALGFGAYGKGRAVDSRVPSHMTLNIDPYRR